MSKQLLLLPTFDGQTRGVAAVNPDAITLIKPAVSPGMTNLYLGGDQNNNYIGVELDMPVLVERLQKAGVSFTDLAEGRKVAGATRRDNEGH